MIRLVFTAIGFLITDAKVKTRYKTLHAQTVDCQQTFNFFFKSQFNDVFWIGESLDGSCNASTLLQLDLNEQESHLMELSMKDFNDWKWVEAAGSYFRKETVVNLTVQEGVFRNRIGSLKVRNPIYKEDLYNQYLQNYKDQCAQEWNWQMGTSGCSYPRIEGKKISRLAYFYNQGLYFNYQIKQAFFLPDTNYLLIITENSMLCNKEKTMHGFMIFKLS